jgi:hypothetical protein
MNSTPQTLNHIGQKVKKPFILAAAAVTAHIFLSIRIPPPPPTLLVIYL